jgi:RND family efflux transporter MFP subunit
MYRLTNRMRGASAAMGARAAVLALAFIAGCSKPPAPPDAAPTVLVAHPLHQQVTEWDDYAGRFEAVESVEVRPRVSGLLQALHFRDGQMVTKGQLLFEIDPRPFAAQLAQAKAQLAHAQAAQINAESQLKRGKSLISGHVLSEADLESLTATERQSEADVAAAQASIDAVS